MEVQILHKVKEGWTLSGPMPEPGALQKVLVSSVHYRCLLVPRRAAVIFLGRAYLMSAMYGGRGHKDNEQRRNN